MVCLTDKIPLVDLFTFDSELAELILTEYPGQILPTQYEIDKSEPEITQFCFYDLSALTLNLFFYSHSIRKDTRLYDIRDSKTGKPIDLSKFLIVPQ